MKRQMLICFLAAGSLLLGSNFISAEVVVTTSVIREIATTFASLFGALRNGDVQKIRLYLSDEEYGRRKVLFEQNHEYPAFLRNFYRGATVRVGEIHSVMNATDDVVTEFIVDFPGGETATTRVRLTRDAAAGWKIKRYLAGKYDQGEPSGKGRR